MPLNLALGNLVDFPADALVNAANNRLEEGGGVCGAIFHGAGRDAMRQACQALAPCETGQAVITPAFKLPAKYVIHAVGPVYHDGKQGEEALLRSAYTNALRLARENKLQTITFPLISSGVYGYPREDALRVAVSSIQDFLLQDEEDLDVTLVLYSRQNLFLDPALKEKLDTALRMAPDAGAPEYGRRRPDQYRSEDQQMPYRVYELKAKKAPERPDLQRKSKTAPPGVGAPRNEPIGFQMPASLEQRILALDEGFSATLLKLVDLKGMKDADVYKAANLDRRHFSKIRSNPAYAPQKQTVLALAIALKLNRQETEGLLARAGYALSGSQIGDVIIGCFIDEKRYDINLINISLLYYDQKTLGT